MKSISAKMYQVLAQKKVKVAKHENFEEALMK